MTNKYLLFLVTPINFDPIFETIKLTSPNKFIAYEKDHTHDSGHGVCI